MSIGDQPNLRERNKARARAEIAAAALRLFGERGFEKVTVDEIVAEAGVSRRTFFRYFETKEDVALADYPELSTRLADSLAGHPTGEPLEAVRAGLHEIAEWYVERSDAVLERSKMINGDLSLAARNLEFLSQWERAISTNLAARATSDGGDLVARTAAAAVVGAFRAALREWVRSSCQRDLHQLTDRAIDIVVRGVAAELAPG